jgi:hypothetical protein
MNIKSTKKCLSVKTSIKAGGIGSGANHNRAGLKVKSSVKAGGIGSGANHNRALR